MSSRLLSVILGLLLLAACSAGPTAVAPTADPPGAELPIITPTATARPCIGGATPLELELPAGTFVRAFSLGGAVGELVCQQSDSANCTAFRLQLRPDELGVWQIEVAMPDTRTVAIVDGVYRAAAEPVTAVWQQGYRQQEFDLTGARFALWRFVVEADEVGCPLIELREISMETTPLAEDVSVDLVGNFLMTDLSAEVCQQAPQLTDVAYAVQLPDGTPLADVAVVYGFGFGFGDYTAVCQPQDNQYRCIAQIPNPLVGQPYYIMAVVNGEEHVSMALPTDTLCMVFDSAP